MSSDDQEFEVTDLEHMAALLRDSVGKLEGAAQQVRNIQRWVDTNNLPRAGAGARDALRMAVRLLSGNPDACDNTGVADVLRSLQYDVEGRISLAQQAAASPDNSWGIGDILHTGLDIAGMVPVIGEIADGANALYYLAEGDYLNAGISAAALIPVAGDAATGARLAGRALKLADDAVEGARVADDIVDGARVAEEAGAAARAAEEAGAAARRGKPGSDWPQLSGMLRDAARGKGNFGIGEGTFEQASAAGKAWVGQGYRESDNGILVSADGLRQYRPPSWKPKLGRYQANFEERLRPERGWQSNGHLDITDLSP